MTVAEILEQAKQLSPQQRHELVEQLQAMEILIPEAQTFQEHWGKNLLKLLDELEPIELIYPEIEDPVEWVKKIREEEQRKRLGDWGEEE